VVDGRIAGSSGKSVSFIGDDEMPRTARADFASVLRDRDDAQPKRSRTMTLTGSDLVAAMAAEGVDTFFYIMARRCCRSRGVAGARHARHRRPPQRARAMARTPMPGC